MTVDDEMMLFARVAYMYIVWFTATEYHLGLLKAKLAKYRQQLLEPQGKASQKVAHRPLDGSPE